MKKLALTLGLLVSISSFATSLKPNDIRLQLEVADVQYNHGPVGSGVTTTIITVNSFGDVVGARCVKPLNPMAEPFDCTSVEAIAYLNAKEVRKINQLVEVARRGNLHFPDINDIHCRALPVESRVSQADNGRVLLEAGSYPCGSVTYNESPAARTLTSKLMSFYRDYQKLVSSN